MNKAILELFPQWIKSSSATVFFKGRNENLLCLNLGVNEKCVHWLKSHLINLIGGYIRHNSPMLLYNNKDFAVLQPLKLYCKANAAKALQSKLSLTISWKHPRALKTISVTEIHLKLDQRQRSDPALLKIKKAQQKVLRYSSHPNRLATLTS